MQTTQAAYFASYRSAYFPAYRSLKLTRDAQGVLVVEFHTNGGPLTFTAREHTDFVDAFYRIAQDRANKIVILTGTGGEFIPAIDFSSFGDVADPTVWSQVHDEGVQMLENLANIRVPVIAAVEGRASVHSDYALLADVIVAGEGATFNDLPHFVGGIVPGDGIFTTWSYRAGAGRAEAFLLNPQPLTAQRAHEWGVVTEVVPNGQALARARELASLYLQAPEITRRNTRVHFIQPLKERIVREVGYGLSLEGASAAYMRISKEGSVSREMTMSEGIAMRQMGTPGQMGMSHDNGGHLYMQTNETQNYIIHFRRAAGGTITEVERTTTGGSGSGVFKPISGEESAPNAFEGADSVIFSPDRRFLFATNGGDNSVSSFACGEGGRLTLLDVCPTGNPVEGRSGTAKALVYGPSTGMLYVLHGFGPDHLRLMLVDGQGKLTPRPERYTVNTHNKLDRVATMAQLSPDGRLLFVGTTWDEPPTANPDGTPQLWVLRAGRGPGFALKSIASNAPDPDGLIVFPVRGDGTLDPATFYDGRGASPWNIRFLHNRPDTFIIGYAVGDGISIGHINANGTVSVGEVVKIDTTFGRPAELCWLSISPDDRTVYATNFGYGYITSFHINGTTVVVAKDPACPRVPGDGTFRALCGDVSSGPADTLITADGAYLYQLYGNAAKLVGYATHQDGSLHEITSVRIPYNSPQGLAGW